MILIELLPPALYALLTAHFVRRAGRREKPVRSMSTMERAMLGAALLVHALVLHLQVFPEGRMRFGFGDALAVMSWLALVFYWLESLHSRLDGLQALGLPFAGFCALLPVIWPERHEIPNADNPLFTAHFVMAMLAYSLFTLAALHALLMAATEKRLHQGRLSRALDALPPLLTMEALLFRLILVAFVLLSATLGSGILFSEALFGKALSFNHKTVFAIGSWAMFGVLLAGRYLHGWRGKLALRLTLGGFFVLLLAYVGTRFVVEVLLGRS